MNIYVVKMDIQLSDVRAILRASYSENKGVWRICLTRVESIVKFLGHTNSDSSIVP